MSLLFGADYGAGAAILIVETRLPTNVFIEKSAETFTFAIRLPVSGFCA